MKTRVLWMLSAVALLWACADEDPIENPNDPGVEGRYTQEVFASVTVQEVQYDAANDLWYDVYMPENDDDTERRVVILGHGGAFVGGNRKNDLMADYATRLAKYGYVVVSYEYRLAAGINDMLDSTSSIGVVARSLADATTVFDEIKASASNGNPYGIDPMNMAIGGNSAGAVLALHMGYLDENDVISSNLQAALDAEGGWDSYYNPTAATEVKAVISLAGGILKTHYLNSYGPQLIMAHGTWDNIVPYGCNNVLNFTQTAIELCGTQPLAIEAEARSITHAELLFPETQHCPWIDDLAIRDQLYDFLVTELDEAMAP
ncbi:alpha/beta hydrolase [Phaeocystidibacter luteus]|uniref:Alpha/beta hydrolase n=1 Tax=Phaeocystidibacter luteus TaxID=911197 RepID=A0A6N6RH05_9FLAO|nr:alpha/beta hydrolase [Phaeocystidibacter luteus]KAB2813646.1 alpha/beta hydrolase [Phaeocystidibacter luteus]